MHLLRLSAIVALAGALLAAPTPSQAATEVVSTVSSNGTTLTLRLHPVSVRAPGFEVLLQQADGSYVAQSAPAERAYLGSVDGKPGAVASAIRASDGALVGQVVFDRGALWRFRDSSVTYTRGLDQPTTFHWPSADDAARNVTTAPGQAGTKTYRWDIGFDLDNAWFTGAPISSSVARALDAVELSAVSLLDVYGPNAMLRPAVGRVIIRGSAAQDPQNGGASLGTLRTEWNTNQTSADVDDVALFDQTYGGGVAYVSSAGTSNEYSVNGGAGDSVRTVLRHELGHTWGAHDNHTNGPEGSTINSGNAYERFDGTELSAIFRYRDSRQAATAPFTAVPALAEPVPPYAAMDLVDEMMGGVRYAFRPTANDHDANLDRVSLAWIGSKTHLGGSISKSGNVASYLPPKVTTRSEDWVKYVAKDATGKTATGVILFRVDPYQAAAPVSTWPRRSGLREVVKYAVTNTQSGLLAGDPMVQRGPAGTKTQTQLIASGSVFKLRNVATQGCWTAETSTRLVQAPCRTTDAQRWRIVEHPRGGDAIVNLKTGRCVAPEGASILGAARLVGVSCGLSASQSWQFKAPAVSAWKTVATPTGSRTLTQVSSGRLLGTFTFTADPDGGTVVKNVSGGKCLDVSGGSTASGAAVIEYGCSGNANQAWRLLANPAGGVSLRSVSSGLCLSTSGTALVQHACDLSGVRRWLLG